MIGVKKNRQLEWKRINMRNVTHLLGVEFIHNLYHRHLPRINSIRFRNTICTWKDGIVESFAPQEEWDILAKWLGRKFLKLDPILIREIKKLINSKHDFLNTFLKSLKKEKLKKMNNIELGLKLIDLQEFVLGEIYKVNLVQLEHALTLALLKLLEKHERDERKRKELLSFLITPKELTEFQKEHYKFMRIVQEGQKRKIKNPKKDKKIYQKIVNHFKKYAYLCCAYGENPRTLNFYIKKYKELFKSPMKNFNPLKELKTKNEKRQEILEKLKDGKIAFLSSLMRDLGKFRDKNKAMLGNTIKYRLMILDEIARRGLENREALNYYLLKEILDLLEKRKKLSKKEIEERKTKGITIIRSEYLEKGIPFFLKPSLIKIKENYLKGICASPGVAEGRTKIVLSMKDINKIKKGDILVTIGTDFDLFEAMLKASGVITEEGGMLSHAAVICREMHKPCCIGVKDATKILQNNSKIRLDATNGIITILS